MLALRSHKTLLIKLQWCIHQREKKKDIKFEEREEQKEVERAAN